jgi:hypothetical protein
MLAGETKVLAIRGPATPDLKVVRLQVLAGRAMQAVEAAGQERRSRSELRSQLG